MSDRDKPVVFNPETGEDEVAESFEQAIERTKELADTRDELENGTSKPN